MLTKEDISNWFKELQNQICSELESLDGEQKFLSETWEHHTGGGGDTRVIQNGALFEKGGVNFSAVHGKTPTKILEALKLSDSDFYATGVSIVIHPNSPKIPIIHMNVRYFEMSTGQYWFGGGIDLTPITIDLEDASKFHKALKSVCDAHDPSYYEKFKNWADDYFYIPHRNETRGIGGIFFDRLNEESGKSKTELFNFIKDVGLLFAKIYSEIVIPKKSLSWTNEDKEWQKIRRGRYVEFNLVYDKGTKFGLDTNGRTESILMSLPNEVSWKYNYSTAQGSPEEFTQLNLVKGKNWII